MTLTTFAFVIVGLLIFIAVVTLYFNRNKTKSRTVQPEKQSIRFRRMVHENIAEQIRHDERKMAVEDPPEIKKLQDLIAEFQDNDGKWDVLITIGDIYRKGAYPRFLPNEHIAMNCYKTAAMCPDGDVAGLGQVKYIEMRSESINDDDKMGKPLPTEYGTTICELAVDKIRTIPFHLFQKPKVSKTQTETLARIPQYEDTYRQFIDDYDILTDDTQNHLAQTYKNDSQNVHDHSVIAISKKNIAVLNQDTDRIDVERSIDKVRDALLDNTELSDQDVSNALLVLDKLSESKHSSFNMSEKEVLAKVWDKIDKIQENDKRKNLTETLGKQLASAVENGYTVCSTGKITRMLGTFDGAEMNDIENVKPLWAVKEEIASLAGKTRNDFIESLDTIQKLAYNRGELPELDEKMRSEFSKQAHKTYCEELNMNPKIINPIIQMYEEGF